ncbi:MAG: hypothetical protein ABUT20_28235 [Bacteroidota bacterium]
MTQTMKSTAYAFVLAFAGFTALSSSAQEWKNDKKVNILFGLAQPLLGSGFNIEGNYIYHRWIFDYSHGASLDFSGKTVTKDLRRQGVAVHEPYTTGFGIGYRVKEWINVRVEPKWHRFEYYYDGQQQVKANEIVSYNTFSLGLGVYGSWQPFKRKNNALKGILISPSIRFWPTVSSSLEGDKFTYFNEKTSQSEEISTLDAGSGFTPLVINVSVGYSFSLKHKR